ncbi:CLUMA_CG001736, isoform A [Clunio marinus]|uniref:CLUMA_CG001736, isoform A n=1 Tax=Clunio marinus TaxID=568069 RepID=A0A1J1HNA3_9DIPT|nr:CLUMA_CG001736, isoform A [Clunio marinus]
MEKAPQNFHFNEVLLSSQRLKTFQSFQVEIKFRKRRSQSFSGVQSLVSNSIQISCQCVEIFKLKVKHMTRLAKFFMVDVILRSQQSILIPNES